MNSNNKQSHHQKPSIDVARMFDKAPPSAIEAEMAVLGSMMLSVDAFGDVVEVLGDARSGGRHFYEERHKVIYEALVSIYDQQQDVDMVRLAQYMTDKHHLELIGGVPYLTELFEAVPSAKNASWYAKIVREKSIIRRLIDISAGTLQTCYQSSAEAYEVLDDLGQQLFELQDNRGGQFQGVLPELIEDTIQKIMDGDGSQDGISTGFTDLDDMLNGLHGGEMLIVAARPSMGKTAFMLNIAENIAVAGHACAVFSLEMGREQLAQRLLCSYSGVDSQRLRKHQLNPDDLAKLNNAAGQLEKCQMIIDDTPGLTLTDLRTKARRLKQKHDIQALFIDYLQLMNCKANSRQEEVSALSRGVKALARELNIPIICLSQLNRSSEGREGHRPRMSDLRESGAIEQDADVIMMVHREDYYHKNDTEYQPNHVGEILIEKQRNGPTGPVKLHWDGGTTRFSNLTTTYAEY